MRVLNEKNGRSTLSQGHPDPERESMDRNVRKQVPLPGIIL
jgi:hypothetical protein